MKLYLIEKEYLKNYLTRYEERYSSLLSDNKNESSGISDGENMEISDGDSVLFDVCRALNTKVRPKLQEGSKDDENLSLQLNSVKNLFEKFNNMEVFHPVSIDSLIDGYSDIVQYAETLNLIMRGLRNERFKFRRIQPRLCQQMCRFLVQFQSTPS